MCLIVFSYRDHPRYDLVFAANRDEFYGRPTRDARFWDERPNLLAGRDLEAGGTWMGITRGGRLAALTNYRDMERYEPKSTSRGELVLQALETDGDTRELLQEVDGRAERYNGFNLLAGSVCRLLYYSNRERRIHVLEPGLYGLSNHLLDTPWPKVRRAKSAMAEILDDEEPDTEKLFGLLLDRREASVEDLPDTGLSPEREKAVSPVFIRSEGYGTRCSTVVTVDKSGQVCFEERVWRPGGEEMESRNRYEFELEGKQQD